MQALRHTGADGAEWELVRQQPPPDLAPWVLGLAGYAEAGGVGVVRRELPKLGVPVIFVIGEGFLHGDPFDRAGWRPLARSFVAGLHGHHVHSASLGRSACLQADFTPAGARRFLGIEPGAIAGQVLALSDVIGPAVDRLEDRLANADSWETRFALLETEIRTRLAAGHPGHPAVAQAMNLLAVSGGGISVGHLARRAGVSRKHLAHLFRREIGGPPGMVGRILRFERALAGLRSGAAGPQAGLAAECGYADEAHFIRDFRAHAGESPARLRARMLPEGSVIEPGR